MAAPDVVFIQIYIVKHLFLHVISPVASPGLFIMKFKKAKKTYYPEPNSSPSNYRFIDLYLFLPKRETKPQKERCVQNKV